MILYKATNKITGQCYIGQTTLTLERRKKYHINDAKNRCCTYFHKSLRKYSIENFIWETIFQCNDKLILNLMETMKIIVNHSHVSEGGYNLSWGGEYGCVGYVHSEKSRKNMSLSHLGQVPWNKGKEGRKLTYEEKEHLRQLNSGSNHPQYGKKKSDKTKKKISLSKKGFISSAETRRKQSESMKGKKHSEETKRKISETKKNNPMSNDMKKEISERMKNRTLSSETRHKMSLAKQSVSIETRHKMSLAKQKYDVDTINMVHELRTKMTLKEISLELNIPKSTIQCILKRERK